MGEKCKMCYGEDYFQKDPDCRNCPVFIDGDCEGSEHNLCVVRSVCPKCNGTGKEPKKRKEVISKTNKVVGAYIHGFEAGKEPEIISKSVQKRLDVQQSTSDEIIHDRVNYGDDGVELSQDEITSLIMEPEEKKDEIREAFEKEKVTFTTIDHSKNHPSYREGYFSGYKSATQKAQSEISVFKYQLEGFKDQYNINHDQLSRIEELEKQIEIFVKYCEDEYALGVSEIYEEWKNK